MFAILLLFIEYSFLYIYINHMAIPTRSSSLRIARRRLRDFRERESCLGETLGEVRGVLENG